MNDLETQLKDTFERHAGSSASRRLPEGTKTKVRRRQVLTSATALTLAAAFVAGYLVLLSLGPQNPNPIRTTTVAPAQGSTAPPAGWPVLGASADQSFVDDAMSFYDGNASNITSAVSTLASGTVDGRSWLVTGFRTDGGGDWGGTAGACGHLFVAPYRDPAFGICRIPQTATGHPPAILPAAHMVGVAPGSHSGDPLGRTMYFGIVDDQVTQIEFRSDTSESWQPALIPGPDGSGVRYFVLFPPTSAQGEVSVLGSDGEVLMTLHLCATAGSACETPRPGTYG